ncbi:MAG: hypothetical protein C5B50_25265 [Verrucomicrobia bacterium]|nr:MAG: hypothetical protein C5B50_25265 [Verrucomicrobiota bacterium]
MRLKRYSRILRGYESRFRGLLQSFRARKLDQGVHWLVDSAQRLEVREQVSTAQAFERVCETLSEKLAHNRREKGALDPSPRQALPPQPSLRYGAASDPGSVRFFCDAGLGGLARWLRAAGYEAFWEPDIQDHHLIIKARELGAVILTTDSGMMERRVLREGALPALWLPPALSIPEQLASVFHEFCLITGEPRCMSCGGQLLREAKEALKDRIPPRTYLWLNEYFICTRCGKLFWHGTHWQHIQRTLESLSTTDQHR